MILKAGDRDTVVTGASTGHPVRVIKNRFSREFQRREAAGASRAELEALGIGKLRAAARDGDIQWGSVMAGQIAGLIRREMSAAEIIQEIVGEAKEVITSWKGVF